MYKDNQISLVVSWKHALDSVIELCFGKSFKMVGSFAYFEI